MLVPDQKLVPEMSVGEIALAYPTAADVFTRYKIDYCCGGNVSFKTACDRANVDPQRVYQEITEQSPDANTSLRDVSRWSAGLLIDYIVQVHHSYVRESIPKLTGLIDKTCRAHGEVHPELIHIRDTFQLLAQELQEHLEKEEKILFPEIRESGLRPYNSLQIILEDVDEEHRDAGERIKSIRQMASNYTLPPDACTTYALAYKKLEEFERDLMQHIHLENNVLLKKVTPVVD